MVQNLELHALQVRQSQVKDHQQMCTPWKPRGLLWYFWFTEVGTACGGEGGGKSSSHSLCIRLLSPVVKTILWPYDAAPTQAPSDEPFLITHRLVIVPGFSLPISRPPTRADLQFSPSAFAHNPICEMWLPPWRRALAGSAPVYISAGSEPWAGFLWQHPVQFLYPNSS